MAGVRLPGSAGRSRRTVAFVTGVARVGAGAGLVARPDGVLRAFGVDSATAARTAWAVRMMGARDLAIGLATVYAAARRRDVRPWLAVGAAADLADAATNADSLRAGQVSTPVAAGSAVLGAASAALQLRALLTKE
jgi:hypothetical protein